MHFVSYSVYAWYERKCDELDKNEKGGHIEIPETNHHSLTISLFPTMKILKCQFCWLSLTKRIDDLEKRVRYLDRKNRNQFSKGDDYGLERKGLEEKPKSQRRRIPPTD